jgi:hypothetical protein
LLQFKEVGSMLHDPSRPWSFRHLRDCSRFASTPLLTSKAIAGLQILQLTDHDDRFQIRVLTLSMLDSLMHLVPLLAESLGFTLVNLTISDGTDRNQAGKDLFRPSLNTVSTSAI